MGGMQEQGPSGPERMVDWLYLLALARTGSGVRVFVPVVVLWVTLFGTAGFLYSGVTVGEIGSNGVSRLIAQSKTAMVVFMAGWCVPCMEEIPALVRLQEKYKEQGLKIIGVSVDFDGTRGIKRLLEAVKATFPVYWGGVEAAKECGISRIPTVFLVKEGRVVDELFGTHGEGALDKKVRQLLKRE